MILVTGAAGKTGLAVLAALRERDAASRALVRREEQVPSAEAAGAKEAVVGNLEFEPDLIAAMRGVDALYFIPPNLHPKEDEIGKAGIVAALKSGVDRFVYHSVLFPQIESMPHHWRKLRVEEALIQSSLDFTILQPANYMQNLFAYWDTIKNEGVWRLPYAPEARSTPVDLAEVAEVAAKVLTEPGYRGAIYPLAGPEVLSAIEMAAHIGRALDRAVRAERQPLVEWEAAAKGLDAERRDTLVRMFAYYDAHDFIGNVNVLRDLLGRQPRRFGDWVTGLDR